MKNTLLLLLSLSLTLCFVTASYGSDNHKAASQDFKLQQASKASQITGQVKSVNEGAGTITATKKFKDKIIEVTAVTDKGTEILRGKERKSLSDIKVGSKVVIAYIQKDGVNLAQSISLK